MSFISIWVVDVDDVDTTIDTIWTLKHRGLIEVWDAATVRWPVGASRPATRPATEFQTDQGLDTAFWGMLFGITFFAAELGPSLEATVEQVAEEELRHGLGTDLTDKLRDAVRPGKGAVITYSSGRHAKVQDRNAEIRAVLADLDADVFYTNLDSDDHELVTRIYRRGAEPHSPVAVVDPIDLRDTYLHLDGSSAPSVAGGSEFWDALIGGGGTARHDAIRRGGWLVTTNHYGGTWPTWEMHPNGDEVVACLSGSLDLRFEYPDGEQVVGLGPGQTVVVPAGIWHTATVHEPGECLHITAGRGTEVRPA